MKPKKKSAPKRSHHAAPPSEPISSTEILIGALPAILASIEAGNRSKSEALARADAHVERLDKLLERQLELIRDLTVK